MPPSMLGNNLETKLYASPFLKTIMMLINKHRSLALSLSLSLLFEAQNDANDVLFSYTLDDMQHLIVVLDTLISSHQWANY